MSEESKGKTDFAAVTSGGLRPDKVAAFRGDFASILNYTIVDRPINQAKENLGRTMSIRAQDALYALAQALNRHFGDKATFCFEESVPGQSGQLSVTGSDGKKTLHDMGGSAGLAATNDSLRECLLDLVSSISSVSGLDLGCDRVWFNSIRSTPPVVESTPEPGVS